MSNNQSLPIKKIIGIGAVLLVILVVTFARYSQALFDDAEVTTHQISMGTLNLQVGESDPAAVNLDFTNLKSGETRVYEIDITNTGELAGNFWFETEIVNSLEGENPEPENNKLEPGDLGDCLRLRTTFDDDTHEPINLIDYSLFKLLAERYETEAGTVIDEMVNQGTKLKIDVNADNCANFAMGDSLDLNLIFHLDQV